MLPMPAPRRGIALTLPSPSRLQSPSSLVHHQNHVPRKARTHPVAFQPCGVVFLGLAELQQEHEAVLLPASRSCPGFAQSHLAEKGLGDGGGGGGTSRVHCPAQPLPSPKGAVRLHPRCHPGSLPVRGDQHPRQRVQAHLQGDGEDRAAEQLLAAAGGVPGERPRNPPTAPPKLPAEPGGDLGTGPSRDGAKGSVSACRP